jgi:hypothetical protein
VNVTMRAQTRAARGENGFPMPQPSKTFLTALSVLTRPYRLSEERRTSCGTIPFSGGADVSRIHERFFASTAMVRTLMSVSPGCARSNL